MGDGGGWRCARSCLDQYVSIVMFVMISSSTTTTIITIIISSSRYCYYVIQSVGRVLGSLFPGTTAGDSNAGLPGSAYMYTLCIHVNIYIYIYIYISVFIRDTSNSRDLYTLETHYMLSEYRSNICCIHYVHMYIYIYIYIDR